VTSGGQPVKDADLFLTGTGARGRARTGADGTYRFDDLRPGAYWIQAVETRGSGAACSSKAACDTSDPGDAEPQAVTVSSGVVTDASFTL